MPKGGLRPRATDGSLEHLIKPKWQSGPTQTIRVPRTLASQLLELAHRLDSGETLDLTQDNNTGSKQAIADYQQAIALLKKAILPTSQGGAYKANAAAQTKRLIEKALKLLEG